MPLFAHLALVLVAGIYLPRTAGRLVPERGAAARVEDAADGSLSARSDGARARRSRRIGPGRACVVDAGDVAARRIVRAVAAGEATLLGLWSDGEAVHLGLIEKPAGDCLWSACRARSGAFPPSARTHPPALRLERAIRDLYGLEPEGCPTSGPGSTTAAGACASRSATAKPAPATAMPYAFPPGRRPAAAPDPGRAGACRHHRARPFPLHRERRDRRAARGAARLRAQGHRAV